MDDATIAGTPPASPAPPSDRPSWLPAKFESGEALAKAYAELERKRGTPDPEPEAAPSPDAPPMDLLLAAHVQEAGIDVNALNTEMETFGSLSPDTMATLNKKGITPEMVGAYFGGLQAQTVLRNIRVR